MGQKVRSDLEIVSDHLPLREVNAWPQDFVRVGYAELPAPDLHLPISGRVGADAQADSLSTFGN
jgi:hypothetical protein